MLLNKLPRVRLTISVWPSVCGCAVLLYFRDVSNFLYRVVQNIAKDLLSRSETMKLGTPCSLIISWKNNLVTCGASDAFQKRIKCAILENQSTTKKMKFTTFCVRGSPNTKSMLKFSQLSFETGKCVYKPVFWACPLETWQTEQLFAIVITSFSSWGQ